MTCWRSSYASGDACEASPVHRPRVPCVALSSLAPVVGLEGRRALPLCSPIDRRHRASKVVRTSRENDRPHSAPRGIGHRRPRRGRTRLPRDEPIRRVVQNVLQARRRRGSAGSMVKVRGFLFSAFARVCAAYEWNCRLVEGDWTDPEIPDPLSDMFALLTARRNRALIQQWGVWLAGKDAERALKVGQCQAISFALGYASHERSWHGSTVIDRSRLHKAWTNSGR